MGNDCLHGAGRGSCTDIKPGDLADIKPSDLADTKPSDLADTKPSDLTDTKPSDFGTSQLDTLMKEIDNLVSLLIKVDEGSEPVETLTGQKQKVLDLLPVTPDNGRYPMHKLLSCRSLTKTEIPVDVLETLLQSGFNVNLRDCKIFYVNLPDLAVDGNLQDVEYFYFFFRLDKSISAYRLTNTTCLNLAIRNDHFAAVRWLMQHGADCDIRSVEHKWIEDDIDWVQEVFTAPIAQLAYKANAPLDLVDLLATPYILSGRLRDDDNEWRRGEVTMPLQIAIDKGHTEIALRLIKLGSRKKLFLIECYLRYLGNQPMQYNDELFTALIPAKTIDILTCVDKVLTMYSPEDNYTEQKEETEANDGEQESEANTMTSPPIKYQMLNRLFQYIIPMDQMCLCFEKGYGERFKITMNRVTFSQIYSSQTAYWWSLLLVNLGWHFKSTPQSVVPLHPVSASKEDVHLAHRIDDI